MEIGKWKLEKRNWEGEIDCLFFLTSFEFPFSSFKFPVSIFHFPVSIF